MSQKQKLVPMPRFRWRKARGATYVSQCFLGELLVGEVLDSWDGVYHWGRNGVAKQEHVGTLAEARALVKEDVLEALGWGP